MDPAPQFVLDLAGLQALLDILDGQGYRVLGPTIADEAIVYDDIGSVEDLPRGWTDAQEGGQYRLEESLPSGPQS